MLFKLVLKPEAEQELHKALDWYDSKNPNSFQKRYKTFRISFTNRFQYEIHYTLDNDVIFVQAILHKSQKLPK